MSAQPTGVEVLELEDLPDDAPDFDPCEDVDGGIEPGAAFGLLGPYQRPATWIEAAFKKWGVPYRVIAGWQTRGRPTGGFDPKGVLVHHTGSTSSATNPAGALATVTNGRPDLAGPLCQVSTGFDGVTTIVAAGRANHAGRMRAMGKLPAGDGNTALIGNEVQTNGTQAMPAAQYAAVVRSTAALLDAMGSSTGELGLHATTSLEGKWDLGAGDGRTGQPFDVNRLRADVGAVLKAGPNPTTTATDWFEMASTADLETVVRKVIGIPVGQKVLDGADGAYLVRQFAWQNTTAEAHFQGLLAAVDALSKAVGVDAGNITDVVDKAVRDRLAEIKLTVSDDASKGA